MEKNLKQSQEISPIIDKNDIIRIEMKNMLHMVFIDKSEVNINMTRIYGRSLDGTRCMNKNAVSKCNIIIHL